MATPKRLFFSWLETGALFLLGSCTVDAGELTWEVVNRFPLVEEASFAGLAKTWDTLPGKRSMHAFITARMEEKAESRDPERFLLVDPRPSRTRVDPHVDYREPVRVKVTAMHGHHCSWTVAPQLPKEQVEEKGCELTLTVPRERSFRIQARDESGQVHGTTMHVKDILIVAMGDSYSSGEGAPDRPAIYRGRSFKEPFLHNDWFLNDPSPVPAVWFEPVCHRSLLSWQVLAALRTALESRDAVVRLIHTACSGAEFYDGLLTAQAKSDVSGSRLENPALARQLTTYRSGEGKRTPAADGRLYLQESQVNTVRRMLCPWKPGAIDVSVAGREYQASWMACPDQLPKRPDALLLTAGGNDVQFSSAVGGLLVPDQARHGFGKPALYLFRKILGLIPPIDLKDNIQQLAPDYPALVAKVIEGALATPDRTVLLAYPNPIGPGGKEVERTCTATTQSIRIRDAFIGFSVAAKSRLPFGQFEYAQWPVEFSRTEIIDFTTIAYPALQRMIASACAVHVDWLQASPPDHGYEERLLCTSHPASSPRSCVQDALEPVYFCQINRGKNTRECEPKAPDRWTPEMPGRRLVNTANDSLLTQRTYRGKPRQGALFGALAGTFHPTVEAHAVAADSAYEFGLCQILREKATCNPDGTHVEF